MTKIKTRKLYQVRIHHFGWAFGRDVGHKCRLVPRAAAMKIAKRLRKTKKFDMVEIYPLTVNVTPEQAAYLDRRYA